MNGHRSTFFYSIKFKYVFATTLMFLLAISTILFIWYHSLTEEAQTDTAENVNSMMQVSNNTFDTYLKDIDGITALLTTHSSNYLTSSIIEIISPHTPLSNAQIVQCRKEANDFLVSLCGFKKYLNGLAVSDLNGNNMTYGISPTFDYLRQQSYYSAIAKQSGTQPLFIPPHRVNSTNNTKDSVLSISRPIIKNQTEIGFVLADVKCSILDNIFNIKSLDGMSILITDNKLDSIIYKSSDTPKQISTMNLSLLKENCREASGNFYLNINGINELIVYQKSSFTGWITVGFVPENVVMKNFIQTRSSMLIISFFFLIAVVAVIYAMSSMLTKNLLKLSNTFHAIGKNDLSIRVKIKSNDETSLMATQLNLMLDRINRLIDENRQAEEEKREAEIQALQSQITPHFLYNTLNTIRFLAVFQGTGNIQKVTENLSALLHLSLDSRRFVTLQEELSSLQCYLEIQKYRYSNKFTYQIFSDASLKNYSFPKMLLQPIAENALSHGIAPLTGEGIITVKCHLSADKKQLNVEIRDNGVGMSQKMIQNLLHPNKSTKHIGLYNIDARLKVYYGAASNITINSEPSIYTDITVSIPATQM